MGLKQRGRAAAATTDSEMPGLHVEADPSEWADWTDQRWEPSLGPGERDLSDAEAQEILRGVRAERICRSLAMRGLAGQGGAA